MRFCKPGLFLLLLPVAFVAAMVWGAEPVHFGDVFTPGSLSHRIVFEFRFPRVLLCFSAGASLALIGVVYQILFRNPLAEPYVLGTASVVTLGAAAGEIFFLNVIAPPLLGFTAGMVLMGVLVWISSRSSAPERVLLFGMGVNFVFSSLLFLMLSMRQQSLGSGSLRWLFGQMVWPSAGDAVLTLGVVVAVSVLVFRFASALDTLSFGDTVARSLGVDPLKVRLLLLTLSSAMLSWIVSRLGTIGFVGLVVPNFVRLAFRPTSSRSLLFLSVLIGGGFLILADLASRTLQPPLEFPIGIVTTILGGPIFLYLLWRKEQHAG